MRQRLLLVVGLVLGLAGCYTSGLEAPTGPAPPYAQAAEHYLDFPDAGALAAYLRAGSEAGPLVSAHRGGPQPGFPENALATFDRALRYAPVLIECDVRLARDSVLVLMHDETLERTSTGTGAVTDHPFTALRRLLLKDEHGIVTPFRLPTLDETLAWAEGRAILTLDVKRDVPPELVLDAVRRLQAEDQVVIIVYSLDDLLRYYRLAPDLVYSVPTESVEDIQRILDAGVAPDRLIAFTGVGEVRPEVIDRLHALNIRAILGTFGVIDERAGQAGPEVFQALIDRGVDVLATDAVPVAARAIAVYPRVDVR